MVPLDPPPRLFLPRHWKNMIKYLIYSNRNVSVSFFCEKLPSEFVRKRNFSLVWSVRLTSGNRLAKKTFPLFEWKAITCNFLVLWSCNPGNRRINLKHLLLIELRFKTLYQVLHEVHFEGGITRVADLAPGPVKISHKKDGCQRRPHRFHVSCPLPLTRLQDPLLNSMSIILWILCGSVRGRVSRLSSS